MYVLGITGASGSTYGLSILRQLLQLGLEVGVIATYNGRKVLSYECGLRLTGEPAHDRDQILAYLTGTSAIGRGCDSLLTVFDNDDMFACIASGSYRTKAMVIAPCSMGTLARISHGVSSNLLERAADVSIKERRPLVVVPRESPLSVIHLQNLLAIAQAGAVVVPPVPGFYTHPESISELVDQTAARILQLLGLESPVLKRWPEGPDSEAASPSTRQQRGCDDNGN